MKKSLVNKVVIPLVVSTGLILGGCFPPLSPKGKAFRDSVGRQIVGDIIRTDIEKSQGHRDYQTNRDNYQRGQERVAHQSNSKKHYIIVNLDTKEKIMVSGSWVPYINSRYDNNREDFPKRGYWIDKFKGLEYIEGFKMMVNEKGHLGLVK
jgi:hypothetical protein